jgi:hypothetical protein
LFSAENENFEAKKGATTGLALAFITNQVRQAVELQSLRFRIEILKP